MKWLWLLVVSVAFSLCACAVLDVHHKADPVSGIPFYVRTGACRHEVAWLEPIYTLTLQSVTTQAGKETVSSLGVAEFSLSQYRLLLRFVGPP
jgi:hypothetical protein